MPRPLGTPCPRCGRMFLNAGLQQHLFSCNPSIVKQECPFCKSFWLTSELGAHAENCPRRPLRDGPVRHIARGPVNPRTGGSNAQRQSYAAAGSYVPGPDGRVKCRHCGRGFAPDRIPIHEMSCAEGHTKPRPQYNSAAARLSGMDGAMGFVAPVSRSGPRPKSVSVSTGPPSRSKSNWRAQHGAFLAMVRAARGHGGHGDQGAGMAGPGGYGGMRGNSGSYGTQQAFDDRVQCPHCTRKFAASTAERHIPACAKAIARPSPPPKAGGRQGFGDTYGHPSLSSRASLLPAAQPEDWPVWLSQKGSPVDLTPRASPGMSHPHSYGDSPGPRASPGMSYSPVKIPHYGHMPGFGPGSTTPVSPSVQSFSTSGPYMRYSVPTPSPIRPHTSRAGQVTEDRGFGRQPVGMDRGVSRPRTTATSLPGHAGSSGTRSSRTGGMGYRPTTSTGNGRARGGIVASNATSPSNPLATNALMAVAHPMGRSAGPRGQGQAQGATGGGWAGHVF